MKNRFHRLLSVLLSFIFLLEPAVSIAAVSDAVLFLEQQPQDAWITMALAASGEKNIDVDYLQSVSGTLATDYAKAILALAAAGENPYSFGSIDYVEKLKTYYNNGQFGSDTLLNDDFWSILALVSVGQDSGAEVASAKDFIIQNQNSDGGWGFAVSGSSDSNDTAAAVMALIAAGVSESNDKIIDALEYLHSIQNDDGGFGYESQATSDAGSSAWVLTALNKLDQQLSAWEKNGNTPVDHIASLQDDDGGYWWVEPGTSDWNNKAMTAFAVIAMSGKSYPVGYYISQQQDEENNDGIFVRIEGKDNTICTTTVEAENALDVIKAAADVCGFEYEINDSAWGRYLASVDGQNAEGMSGWLYFVNNSQPQVGASEYEISNGDSVLWYYGDFDWLPSRVTVSDTEIDTDQEITITAQYFTGTNWAPIPNAKIYSNGSLLTADVYGTFYKKFEEAGVYTVLVETNGYVRSNKVNISVGGATSGSTQMSVEIVQSDDGEVLGESIGIEVSPQVLNFGILKPGEQSMQVVSLRNIGTVNLGVTAEVVGDAFFSTNLLIDQATPQSFFAEIAADQQKNSELKLIVPQQYLGQGVKNGELIFWAQRK